MKRFWVAEAHKQQRKRLNKKRSKIINIKSCPSDTVNTINSCMIKCFFLVVLKVKCLVSLCVPIWFQISDSKFPTVAFHAQDHFAIVNNSYYSLTCIYLDFNVILCNTLPVLFIFFELATRVTLNTRIEKTDNFIYIKVLNMMH